MLTRILWLALAAKLPLQGAAVYVNGAPSTANASLSLTVATAADLFTTPGTASVAGVRFWITATSPAVPDPQTSFSGDIYYAFFTNNLGLLGTKLTDGVVTGLVSVPTGQTVTGSGVGISAVEFNLVAPQVLAGGTSYWLLLHEGTSLSTYDGSELGWVSSGSGNGKEGPLGSLPNGFGVYDGAYELHDTAFASAGGTGTPEPATWGVTGLALLAALARRR